MSILDWTAKTVASFAEGGFRKKKEGRKKITFDPTFSAFFGLCGAGELSSFPELTLYFRHFCSFLAVLGLVEHVGK